MAAITRGDRLLLRFHIDLGQVHERFVLSKDIGGEHFAVTPDRRRVLMTLGDGAVQDLWLVDQDRLDRLPAGVAAADVVRAGNSVVGEFSTVEMAYFDSHGIALEA